MSDFYRGFEDRFRGTREAISAWLGAYTPFLLPLKQLQAKPKALDIGCGSGEWLRILVEHQFDALGVDLDEGMLEACTDLGLNAQKLDALEWLREQPANSVSLIEGFHVVEHLPFEILQEIVQVSLRALVPAGLLILETPNPENLVVATKTFYLDPTHNKPIPPELLCFLAERLGFLRAKIVRLQEREQMLQKATIGIFDLCSGASPDYSIVAQKHEEPDVVRQFEPAFEKEYGLSFVSLAHAYDRQVEDRIYRAERALRAIQSSLLWRAVQGIRRILGLFEFLVPPSLLVRYRRK